MNLPSNWSEVSLSIYRKLTNIPSDLSAQDRTVRVITCFLPHLSKNQIKKLPPYEYYKIVDALQFVSSPVPSKFSKFFTLDNTEFGIIPNLNNLSVGEIIDLEEYVSKGEADLHKIMSVIYRPVVQKDKFSYKVEEYDTDRAEIFASMFDEKLGMDVVSGASLFFSIISTTSILHTTLYSERTLNTTPENLKRILQIGSFMKRKTETSTVNELG